MATYKDTKETEASYESFQFKAYKIWEKVEIGLLMYLGLNWITAKREYRDIVTKIQIL